MNYPGPFHTVDDIKQANERAGNHFFEPATMRFFRSRIAPGVIGGRIIITSEQFESSTGWRDARKYTLRVFGDDGVYENHYDDSRFDFQAYDTLPHARKAAYEYLYEQYANA